MAKKYDDDLFEEVEFDDSLFDDAVEVPQSEAALRGAAQGLTFDFADEAQAGLESMYEDFKKAVKSDPEAPQPTFDEQGRITNLAELSKDDDYAQNLERIRDQYKAAREQHPGTYIASDIAAGAIPAILTGGTTAVANIGKSIGKGAIKGALKPAIKEGAKLGAKYGALSGLGLSEADLTSTEGLKEGAQDVAVASTLGAGLGAALPVALKTGKEGLGLAKQGASAILDKFPSVKTGFKFGQKYGLANDKKINNLFEDNTRDLVKNIKAKFQELGLSKKASEKKAAELGETYDLTGDIKQISQKFKDQTKGLMPEEADKAAKMIQDLEEGFLRVDVQRQKLIGQVQEEINKKAAKSANKAAKSTQKMESKAVIDAENKGYSLEQLEDINKKYEQVSELPYDTKGGQIKGQKAKFKDEYMDIETGEMVPYEFSKKYVEDVTPFQPSPIKTGVVGEKNIAQYADEATGEVFTKSGPLSRYADQDFSKLSVDEILELIPVYGTKAFDEGGANKEIYKELYKTLRNKLPEISGDLPKNKQEMVKLYQTMDILGVNKNRLNPSHADVAKLAKKLPGKLGIEKDIIERNLIDPKSKIGRSIEELEFLADAKKYLGEGYTSATGEYTKAGVIQKGVSSVTDVAGAAYAKATENKAARALKGVANKVSDLSDGTMQRISKSFNSSENTGLQAMGRQLEAALKEEGPVKKAMIWSLSQNPAFRKSVETTLPEIDRQISEDLGVDIYNPLNQYLEGGEVEPDLEPEETPLMMQGVEESGDDLFEEVEYSEEGREPSGAFLDKHEGGAAKVGYVPRRSSKSGVTIATGLDLANFDTSVLGLSPELEAKLAPYKGVKGKAAAKIAGNLTITDEEAEAIDTALEAHNAKKVNKLTAGVSDEINTEGFQEGLESLNHNTPSAARALMKRVKAGKVDEAIDKGVEWNKTGGRFAAGLLTRRMEELYKMFPEKAEMIQAEGKIEYNKYRNQTKRSWDQVNTVDDQVEEAKKAIDRQIKQQSAGDNTPESHVDQTLGALDNIDTDQVNIDALQDEALKMETNVDAEKLKHLLDGLKGLGGN